MKKPTKAQLKKARGILVRLCKYFQEYQPYRLYNIRALEAVMDFLPFDADKLEDVYTVND